MVNHSIYHQETIATTNDSNSMLDDNTPQSPRSVRTGFVVDVVPDDMDEKMMTRDRKHQQLACTHLKKKTKRKRSSHCCSNENDDIAASMLQQQEQVPSSYIMPSSSSSRAIDCDDDKQQHQQQHRVRLSSNPPQRITWRNPEQDLSEKQVLKLRAKLWYTRKEYTEFSNERLQTVRKLRALQVHRNMQIQKNMERGDFMFDSNVSVVEPSPLLPTTVAVRDSCCNTLPLKEQINNNTTNIFHDVRTTPRQHQASTTVEEGRISNTIADTSKPKNGSACSNNDKHNDDGDKGGDGNFCLRGLEIHLLSKRQYAQARSYRNLYTSTILKRQKLLRMEHEERKKKMMIPKDLCGRSQQQQNWDQQKKTTTIAWDFDRTHRQVRHLTSWAQERAQERALCDPDEEFDKYGKFPNITTTNTAAKRHFRSIPRVSPSLPMLSSSSYYGGNASHEQSLERMQKKRRINSPLTAVPGSYALPYDASASFATSRDGWTHSMQPKQGHNPLMTPLPPPPPPQQHSTTMMSYPQFWHLYDSGSYPVFYNHYHHHDAQYYPSETRRT